MIDTQMQLPLRVHACFHESNVALNRVVIIETTGIWLIPIKATKEQSVPGGQHDRVCEWTSLVAKGENKHVTHID